MSQVLFLCWGEGMLGFDFSQDFILELPGVEVGCSGIQSCSRYLFRLEGLMYEVQLSVYSVWVSFFF